MDVIDGRDLLAAKIAKIHLFETMIVELKKDIHCSLKEIVDSLDNEEARANLLKLLYWGAGDDIPSAWLAEAYGLKNGSQISRLIDPVYSGVKCTRCGKDLLARSRNMLADLRKQEKGIVCDQCRSIQSTSWHKEDVEDRYRFLKRQEELKAMPYGEYLKTPEWQERRGRHLKQAKYKCQLCNEGGQLHVHHRTYENRGREGYTDLIVLCAKCHQKFHGINEETTTREIREPRMIYTAAE